MGSALRSLASRDCSLFLVLTSLLRPDIAASPALTRATSARSPQYPSTPPRGSPRPFSGDPTQATDCTADLAHFSRRVSSLLRGGLLWSGVSCVEVILSSRDKT